MIALAATGFACIDSLRTAEVEYQRRKTDLFRDQGLLIAANTTPQDYVLCSRTAWPSQFYADRAMPIEGVVSVAGLRYAAQFADQFGIQYEHLYYVVGRNQEDAAAALVALAEGPILAQSEEHKLYRLPRSLLDRFRGPDSALGPAKE